MKFNYDKIADAAYLLVREGKVGKTVEINDRLNVDLDKDGNIVGFEMLEYSTSQNVSKLEEMAKTGVPMEITMSTPQTA